MYITYLQHIRPRKLRFGWWSRWYVWQRFFKRHKDPPMVFQRYFPVNFKSKPKRLQKVWFVHDFGSLCETVERYQNHRIKEFIVIKKPLSK